MKLQEEALDDTLKQLHIMLIAKRERVRDRVTYGLKNLQRDTDDVLHQVEKNRLAANQKLPYPNVSTVMAELHDRANEIIEDIRVHKMYWQIDINKDKT